MEEFIKQNYKLIYEILMTEPCEDEYSFAQVIKNVCPKNFEEFGIEMILEETKIIGEILSGIKFNKKRLENCTIIKSKYPNSYIGATCGRGVFMNVNLEDYFSTYSRDFKEYIQEQNLLEGNEVSFQNKCGIGDYLLKINPDKESQLEVYFYNPKQ